MRGGAPPRASGLQEVVLRARALAADQELAAADAVAVDGDAVAARLDVGAQAAVSRGLIGAVCCSSPGLPWSRLSSVTCCGASVWFVTTR